MGGEPAYHFGGGHAQGGGRRGLEGEAGGEGEKWEGKALGRRTCPGEVAVTVQRREGVGELRHTGSDSERGSLLRAHPEGCGTL